MKFLTSLVVTMLFSITAMADIAFKNGDKVAFLGDSITYLGAVYPSGYCRLVDKALEWKGIKCDMVYAGISGHKSNQMLERLDRDVLAHKPQWMFLSCGVNDVWHGENGVPLPQYKENITKLVEKAQAAGVNVIILASTLIGEDLNGDNNRKLNEYNDFLKNLAAEKNLPFVDLNSVMKQRINALEAKGRTPGTLLTVDGVHMNPAGNMIMAEGILKTIGFTDGDMAETVEKWQAMPAAWPVRGQADISVGQWLMLESKAAKEGLTIDQYLNRLFQKTLANIEQ